MSVSRPAAVIVLAAGEGTRMKSRTPKVLHGLCGRSMLGHVLAAVRPLQPERTVVVVGHGREAVAAHLAEIEPSAIPVVQEPQRGTGHAVRVAIEALGVPQGTTLVMYADTPLLRTDTLAALLEIHDTGGDAMTALTAKVPDPTGYGRIIRREREGSGDRNDRQDVAGSDGEDGGEGRGDGGEVRSEAGGAAGSGAEGKTAKGLGKATSRAVKAARPEAGGKGEGGKGASGQAHSEASTQDAADAAWDEHGTRAVREVVEERDATPEQRAIREINCGIYAFDGALLADAVKRLSRENAQSEEYLTDLFAVLRDDGQRVGTVLANDFTEILGINDRVQLAEIRRLLNDRILTGLMRDGVTIVDPRTTWIDAEVTCEPDAIVQPGTQLMGRTHLAAGAAVGPGCSLLDTIVGEDATVIHAVCVRSEIGPEANVGPYAYLRPGTLLGEGAKVGTFVEVKASSVGDRSKVPHLSYVGDAEIGEDSNVGAATVFVNYDGQEKHHTTVGDHVRVGSDTMLIAPVTIGDGAYTAAGSVVTEDVPPGALAVARGRQRNVEGWVERKRPATRAAEAARRARRAGSQSEDTSA